MQIWCISVSCFEQINKCGYVLCDCGSKQRLEVNLAVSVPFLIQYSSKCA